MSAFANSRLKRVAILAALALRGLFLHAAEQAYSSDLATWQEVLPPPESDREARFQWGNILRWSKDFPTVWRVFLKGGRVHAEDKFVDGERTEPRGARPPFKPETEYYNDANRFAAVDDGWLVGFNHGEFGGALYWFSRNGKSSYEISRHQVIDFIFTRDGIYAIEGMLHFGSMGSVIRISRPKPKAHWQAATFVKLWRCPLAVSLQRDGTMLLSLSDRLVAVECDGRLQDLIPNPPPLSDTWLSPPWSGATPTSSVLTPDEQTLYVGLTKFVAEVDLKTKKVRLLVPSAERFEADKKAAPDIIPRRNRP